jgi:hypothetical protein
MISMQFKQYKVVKQLIIILEIACIEKCFAIANGLPESSENSATFWIVNNDNGLHAHMHL